MNSQIEMENNEAERNVAGNISTIYFHPSQNSQPSELLHTARSSTTVSATTSISNISFSHAPTAPAANVTRRSGLPFKNPQKPKNRRNPRSQSSKPRPTLSKLVEAARHRMPLYDFEQLGLGLGDELYVGQGQGQGQGQTQGQAIDPGLAPKAILSNYLFFPAAPEGNDGDGNDGQGQRTEIYKLDRKTRKLVQMQRVESKSNNYFARMNSSRSIPSRRSSLGSGGSFVNSDGPLSLWGDPNLPSGATLISEVKVGPEKIKTKLPIQPTDPRLFDPKMKGSGKSNFGAQFPPPTPKTKPGGPVIGQGHRHGTAQSELSNSDRDPHKPVEDDIDGKSDTDSQGYQFDLDKDGEVDYDNLEIGVAVEEIYKLCPQPGAAAGAVNHPAQERDSRRSIGPSWPLGYMQIAPPSYTLQTTETCPRHRLIAISDTDILSTRVQTGSCECFVQPIIYPKGVEPQPAKSEAEPSKEKPGVVISPKAETSDSDLDLDLDMEKIKKLRLILAQNKFKASLLRSETEYASEVSLSSSEPQKERKMTLEPEQESKPELVSVPSTASVPVIIKTANELAVHLAKFASSRSSHTKLSGRGRRSFSHGESSKNRDRTRQTRPQARKDKSVTEDTATTPEIQDGGNDEDGQRDDHGPDPDPDPFGSSSSSSDSHDSDSDSGEVKGENIFMDTAVRVQKGIGVGAGVRKLNSKIKRSRRAKQRPVRRPTSATSKKNQRSKSMATKRYMSPKERFLQSIASRAELVRSIQEPIDFKKHGISMSTLLSMSPVQRLKFMRSSTPVLGQQQQNRRR